jgi:molybdopterin molybdotransferase
VIDHSDYLLELVEPQPEFGIKLFDALGLTLCESIRGDGNVPDTDLAEVDGYAVRAVDTEYADEDLQVVGKLVTLSVVPRTPVLQKGTAVRVATGEPLPLGADAVVPLAETEERVNDSIALLQVKHSGDWVRGVGADVTDREIFAHPGEEITGTLLGVLSAAGFDRVLARPAARVAVLSFDGINELDVVADSDRRGRHLRSACSFLISSALRADKATVWRTDVTTFEPADMRELFDSELVRSDIIIATSAIGIAALRDEMSRVGAADFCQVAMEPGSDQAFALIGERKVPVFLLPADPMAALCSYLLFVRPVLRKLMGVLPHRLQPQLGFTTADMHSEAGVFELCPVKLRQAGGRLLATQCGRSRLATLADLAQADAMMALPEDKTEIAAGEPVQIWQF